MWNPSYFVATVSDTLEENIKEYISNQGKYVLTQMLLTKKILFLKVIVIT